MAVPTKSSLLRQRGDTLVEVPCWWDGLIPSLAATILFHRPDLQHVQKYSSAYPIPFYPPMDSTNLFIPNVGLLMLASFPLPGFTKTITPENPWWLGEKYDGVRFCWNIEDGKLYHYTVCSLIRCSSFSIILESHIYARMGTELPLPPVFYNISRDFYYDGEMWFGRGRFVDSMKLTHGSTPDSLIWSLRSIVFDAVMPSNTFEQRYKLLLQNVAADSPMIYTLAPRVLCTNKKMLLRFIGIVTSKGGEGAIIRQFGSVYTSGRSSSLLKLKTSRGDTEGLVVSIKGLKMTIRLPSRYEFQINLEIRRGKYTIPKKGDIITFSYDHFNQGVPKNPKFVRIRNELSWRDVIQSTNSYFKSLNAESLVALNSTERELPTKRTKEIGRRTLELHARSLDLDPLLPSTWYSMTATEFRSHKDIKLLINTYKASYVRMIIAHFPDLNLDPSKFKHIPRSHWDNIGTCRKLFIAFAKANEFDPFVANNWYSRSLKSMLSYKGIGGVISRYKTVRNTISCLFPEIGSDGACFRKRYYWNILENRRKFLDEFAKFHGFNPLEASNWYSFRQLDFLKFGCTSAALLDLGDFKKFIIATYPEIGIDVTLFKGAITRNHWQNMHNRRAFFENTARASGFDPLIPNNWYTVPLSKLWIKTKFTSIMEYYTGKNYKFALQDVFPELDLKQELFRIDRRKYKTKKSMLGNPLI